MNILKFSYLIDGIASLDSILEPFTPILLEPMHLFLIYTNKDELLI